MAENEESSYDAQPVSYSDDEHAQNTEHASNEPGGDEGWRRSDQQQQSGENNGHSVAKNLYVSNLDPKTDEDGIRPIFEVYGAISNIEVIRDPVTKVSRGFAFITYANPEHRFQAIEKLNGTVLNDRALRVEESRRSGGYTKTPGQYMGPARSARYPRGRDEPRGGYRGRSPDRHAPDARRWESDRGGPDYGRPYRPRSRSRSRDRGYPDRYAPRYDDRRGPPPPMYEDRRGPPPPYRSRSRERGYIPPPSYVAPPPARPYEVPYDPRDMRSRDAPHYDRRRDDRGPPPPPTGYGAAASRDYGAPYRGGGRY